MPLKAVVVSLLVVGTALVVFHQPIIEYIESATTPKDARAVVGQIEDTVGEVTLSFPGQMDSQLSKKGDSIRHQDIISTGQNSRAIVRVKGGLALELESDTSLVFEQLDHTLITFQRGNFKVIEKGTGAHDVVILKEGVLQDPEGRTIPASNLLKTDVADSEEIPETTPQPEENSKTLSDAYIASVIQAKKGFMNRCYAQALRTNPKAKGEIQLTFSIAPNGDVGNLKVLKSTLGDDELQKCILAVIERARFRSFEGDPVVVNYPIYFE